MFHHTLFDEFEGEVSDDAIPLPLPSRMHKGGNKIKEPRAHGKAAQVQRAKPPIDDNAGVVTPRAIDFMASVAPRSTSRKSNNKIIHTDVHPTLQPSTISRESKESTPAEKFIRKGLDSGRRVVLKLGGDPSQAAPADVDQTLYVSVLKQLLGDEVRNVMREELERALAHRRPHFEARLDSNVEQEGDEAKSPNPGSNEESMFGLTWDMDLHKHGTYMEDGMKDLATGSELIHVHRGLGKSGLLSYYWNPCLERLERFRVDFGTVTAPNQDVHLRKLLESRWWNAAVNLVVVVNCVIMSLSADYQVRNADVVESTDNVFFWFDIGLLAFYSVEFLLKLGVYRQFFFYDVNWKSNYLDTVLLFTSLGSLAFTLIASVEQLHQNYTWLRLFRLVRLLRTLRVIRLASYFSTLRAILSSLLDSFWMLAWSITMLSLTFFMFSLIFVSRVAGIIHSNRSAWEAGEYQALLTHFGSVSLATKTLIMASMGGADWGDIYDALEPNSYFDAALFLFFIFFIEIAVLNIILGIFVEDAMKHMQPDTERKAHQLALEQKRLEDELRRLCCKTDLNDSGQISTYEWETALEDGKVHELLDLLGFPKRHANRFFGMMAHTSESGEKYVNIDEFVRGCIKLRGSASSFDMNALLLEVKDTRDLVMSEVKILYNMVQLGARL